MRVVQEVGHNTRRGGRMIAAVALCVAATMSTSWVVDAQSADGIAGALEWLGASADDAAAVDARAATDALGDTFRYATPGATPATLAADFGDIVAHAATAARFDGFGPDKAETVPCNTRTPDDALVLCHDADSVVLDGDFWLFTMEVAGDIPLDDDGFDHSMAFPVLRNGGVPWETQGNFLWDTYQGTDLWFTVERTSGSDWVLAVVDSTAGFAVVDTGAFAVINGATLTVAVPAPVLGFDLPPSAQGLRGAPVIGPCYGAAQHTHQGDYGASPSSLSIVDSAPDTNTDVPRTPEFLAKPGPGIIIFGAPEPPPTTTTTTTTTTLPAVAPAETPVTSATTSTTEATTPAAAPPADPPIGDPPPSDGGGIPPWMWVVGTLILLSAIVSVGLYFSPKAAGAAKCVKEKEAVEAAERKLKEAEAKEKEARADEKKADGAFSDAQFGPRNKDYQKRYQATEAAAKKAQQASRNATMEANSARGELKRAKAALAKCLEKPEEPPTPPASAPPSDPAPPPCCESKIWYGLNVTVGGGVVVGYDSGYVFLTCHGGDQWVIVEWQGFRTGIVVGGQAATSFVVVNGPTHPYEVPQAVAKVMGGFDWDVSLGGSVKKIVGGGYDAAKQGGFKAVKEFSDRYKKFSDTMKEVRKLEKGGKTVAAKRASQEAADLVEEFGREGMFKEVLDTISKGSMGAPSKGGSSLVQSGFSGISLTTPASGALQIGGWLVWGVTTELINLSGCKACDPSMIGD